MVFQGTLREGLLGVDATFLRQKEEQLRLLGQELSGLWVHQIQAIMVDDGRLLTEPLGPTNLADGVVDAVAQFSRQRRLSELPAVIAAAGAFDIRHSRDNLTERRSGRILL